MKTCPRCGAELDDFGPCGCAVTFDHGQKPKPKGFSMRNLVHRKLAKQREAKEKTSQKP